ncbi:MAG: InlB B-repeat-containing protein [Spirochaetales bacterium]|nr:InlB B-repeat-containing protein [Spirochaetales bacterium]
MKKALLICLVAIALIGLVACKQDPKTCRISFDANGGTGDKMADLSATYGREVTLTKDTYKRTGYTFAGWNEDKDALYPEYGDEGTFVPKEDTTLYAIWEADLSNSTWEAETDAHHIVRLVFDDKDQFTLTINGTQYGKGDFLVVADDLMLSFEETEGTDLKEKYAYFKAPDDLDVVIIDENGALNPATLEFTRDFDNGKYYYPVDYEIHSNPTHQTISSIYIEEVDDALLFTKENSVNFITRNYSFSETNVYTCNTVVPEGKLWTFSIPVDYKISQFISTEFVYDVTPEESTLSFYFGRMHIGEYLEFTKVVE